MKIPNQVYATVTLENKVDTYIQQSYVLSEVAKVYGFKQPIPYIKGKELFQQRSFNSRFNTWKVQLNEFTKGIDRLPVGCIDVLSGKQDYPEVNLLQRKVPKFKCEFNHKDFV